MYVVVSGLSLLLGGQPAKALSSGLVTQNFVRYSTRSGLDCGLGTYLLLAYMLNGTQVVPTYLPFKLRAQRAPLPSTVPPFWLTTCGCNYLTQCLGYSLQVLPVGKTFLDSLDTKYSGSVPAVARARTGYPMPHVLWLVSSKPDYLPAGRGSQLTAQ